MSFGGKRMKKNFKKDRSTILGGLSNYTEWNRHNLHQEIFFMATINDFQRRENHIERKRFD
jgi:hypothetical protein